MIYCFKCDCGHRISIEISYFITKEPYPPCYKCKTVMYRDYEAENKGIVLKGLGWSRDGHSTDIDDAEEFWKKDGKPVGNHVGNISREEARKLNPPHKKKTRYGIGL